MELRKIHQLMKRLLVITIISALSLTHANGQSADSIARAMFAKTKTLKTVTYTMTKYERIDGELQKQIAAVKLQKEPFKVYSKQIEPDEGLEVLYIGGDKTALINPNGFPWFNVKLSPTGSRMTKGQHHTILDSGFDTFVAILEFLFNKYEKNIHEISSLTSETKDGKSYWKLDFNNPNFKILEYEVKANEDVLKIAKERFISSFMIMELNPKLEDFEDISAGDVIKIPNDYSPRMTLYIDKKLMVPSEIIVEDKLGIYERYNFTNIKLNPKIKPEEFTPGFDEYGF